MIVKAIILDIDGTLLNHQKLITERTKQALMNAQAKGIKIVLASGRPTRGMMKLVHELEMDKHHGLMVSYNAFKNATAKKPLKNKDGFTPDQRFFLAYAGVWGQNITDKEIRNRVKNDPHSLGKWRVDGALPHIDAWYEAFGVKQGDKLFIPKNQRLELW